MSIHVKLSKLEASRQNPRRVKPEREAHKKLVASIRAHGLLEPLIVRASEGKGRYRVIAGNRRLAALREAFRGEDPAIECIERATDDAQAAGLGLAENFAREPMHPLDEAEAFAKLASVECKGVKAIAAEFGVSEGYIRQRRALADLIDPIKASLRQGEIGVGVAEAFSAVPPARQAELWRELGGEMGQPPQSAEHVRSLIHEQWIPAERALFDVGGIEPADMTQNLYGEEVLIARAAFMKAQREAMQAESVRQAEDGWAVAVLGPEDDRYGSMRGYDVAEPEYDPETRKALQAIEERREALNPEELSDEEYGEQLDALEREETAVLTGATATFSEATKARGTVFLVLSPDGRVERHHRVKRGKNPQATPGDARDEAVGEEAESLPTCDQLTDAQTAELRTHELLAVREALMSDPLARKRLLVMALHDHVGRDAIMVRVHPSGADRLAATNPEFRSPLRDGQIHRRKDADPFFYLETLSEVGMYERLKDLTEPQLDELLANLTVALLTNSTGRRSSLIEVLMDQLGVEVRKHWIPEASWLKGYTKAQLADLIGKLQGPPHGSAALKRKKSELLTEAAELFKKAAEEPDSVGDAELAERVCQWMPEAESRALESATAE